MNDFFSKEFLLFFIDLASNNRKDWFDANRTLYEQFVKKPFENFVQHMIHLFAKTDSSFSDLQAKDCIFRINRDIRFSKDKTPYKTMCSAVLAPFGKKSKSINGIYFELSPEHIRVYGGIYEIDKEDLNLLRSYISHSLKEFQKLYSNPDFVAMFDEIKGEKNKILPAHLRPSAEKESLLFNKQWYFFTEFSSEWILNSNVDKKLLECYLIGKPIEDYFNKCLNRN